MSWHDIEAHLVHRLRVPRRYVSAISLQSQREPFGSGQIWLTRDFRMVAIATVAERTAIAHCLPAIIAGRLREASDLDVLVFAEESPVGWPLVLRAGEATDVRVSDLLYRVGNLPAYLALAPARLLNYVADLTGDVSDLLEARGVTQRYLHEAFLLYRASRG